ncbi:MAG: hypothetical protein MJA28_02370 [Gammaproteobacteria bacterium]|nr:hypothetical protein [Gammaproteobacteria bacterium]
MKVATSPSKNTDITATGLFNLPLLTTSKSRVFLTHLAISFGIFLTILGFMLISWFPGPLFHLDGGWQGLRLMAAVDIVLGPTLTLLFYKPGRRSALLDLSAIACVQVLALGWGVWAVYHQSTAALVFSEGRFVTLSYQAHQQANDSLEANGIETQSTCVFAESRVPHIYARPIAAEHYGQYLASVLNGNPEHHEHSHRYAPLAENIQAMERFQVLPEQLPPEKMAQAKLLEAYATQYHAPENLRFYHLKTRYGNGFAVIDQQKRAVIDLLH